MLNTERRIITVCGIHWRPARVSFWSATMTANSFGSCIKTFRLNRSATLIICVRCRMDRRMRKNQMTRTVWICRQSCWRMRGFPPTVIWKSSVVTAHCHFGIRYFNRLPEELIGLFQEHFLPVMYYLISIWEIISNSDLTKVYGNHILIIWKRLKTTNIKLHMNL